MGRLLIHVYQYAEVYTVLLAWVVVPLGFLNAYLFLKNQMGVFSTGEETDDKRTDTSH